MTTATRALLSQQISNVDFGVIDATPTQLAGYFLKYVHFGSQRYTLARSDLTVFHKPDFEFAGKNEITTKEIKGKNVPDTLDGHLKIGTKFLDAVLYMHIPEDLKPETQDIFPPSSPTSSTKLTDYGDHKRIARFMFFYYFYILTRARAPGKEVGSNKQPVPKFLSTVLSISGSAIEVSDYLASFDLALLDPAWARHVDLKGLSQESLSRFGIGVAGYRLAQPFKIREPDGSDISKYAGAIVVANSFATQPSCWDFHPATRNPNLLTTYGNINKNLSNLILKVYKKETIDLMVTTRILFEFPKEDLTHTNYTKWDATMVYKTSAPIFMNTP